MSSATLWGMGGVVVLVFTILMLLAFDLLTKSIAKWMMFVLAILSFVVAFCSILDVFNGNTIEIIVSVSWTLSGFAQLYQLRKINKMEEQTQEETGS